MGLNPAKPSPIPAPPPCLSHSFVLVVAHFLVRPEPEGWTLLGMLPYVVTAAQAAALQ